MKVVSRIPALLFAGGKDAQAALVNMRESLWKTGRQLGAPWTFAVEPNATHGDPKDLTTANELLIPWITAVLRHRLSPDGTLRALADSSAWMGSMQSGEIAPYASFVGSKPEASWLPDEASARGWQRIVREVAK